MARGTPKGDRTGAGTLSVFGRQLRYDLSGGFRLISTKSVHFQSIAYELLWILRGETNVKWLNAQGVTICDEWADIDGERGPIYGRQWRSWPARDGGQIDQITSVIEEIAANAASRRLVNSEWKPADLGDMVLPPCHVLYQFSVTAGKLSCQVYQRSADLFLGLPFNIASYALLAHLIAAQVGLEVGELIWTGGECHSYTNHARQVGE